MGELVGSGFSLNVALSLIQEFEYEPKFIEVVQSLHQHLQIGGRFSDGLLMYPSYFPGDFIAIVCAGEQGGFFHESLLGYAEHLDRMKKFSS